MSLRRPLSWRLGDGGGERRRARIYASTSGALYEDGARPSSSICHGGGTARNRLSALTTQEARGGRVVMGADSAERLLLIHLDMGMATGAGLGGGLHEGQTE